MLAASLPDLSTGLNYAHMTAHEDIKLIYGVGRGGGDGEHRGESALQPEEEAPVPTRSLRPYRALRSSPTALPPR